MILMGISPRNTICYTHHTHHHAFRHAHTRDLRMASVMKLVFRAPHKREEGHATCPARNSGKSA
jgi:hypothetical protein